MKKLHLVLLLLCSMMLWAYPSLSQTAVEVADPAVEAAKDNEIALGSDKIFSASLRALTILLVTAILIENALAVLFNWRVFLAYFSLKGVRTIILVAVSLAVVISFDLDVLGDLLDQYLEKPNESWWLTYLLTALILAGGSSGVHSLMVSLGYRDSRREAELNPKPRSTAAWVAVRVDRRQAVGPVQVRISETTDADPTLGQIAGTITPERPSLVDLLFRNRDRFPQNGGYEVEVGKVYRIELIGRDAEGNALLDPFAGRHFSFAPRAIVDFRETL